MSPVVVECRRRGFLRAFRTMVPILDARDVGLAMLVAIPSLEAVDAEEPESRAHVRKRHQSVVVPHVHAERALLDARRALPAVVGRAAEAVLVLALTGVPVSNRLRI